MAMSERQFFVERLERRPTSVTCTRCRHAAEYPVTWMRRVRRATLPPGADARDRETFASLRDYLIRIDVEVMCAKCKRRIEIPAHQSLVFL